MDTAIIFSALRETDYGKDDPLIGVKAALIKIFYDCGFYFDVDNVLEEILDHFTLDFIVSCWAEEEIHIYSEDERALPEEGKAEIRCLVHSDQISLKRGGEDVLSGVYLYGCEKGEKKKKGLTYTPERLCEYMTALIRKKAELSQKVLDPACGSGVLLCGYYDAIMAKFARRDSEVTIYQAHRYIIEELIYGCDISPEGCAITKLMLALKYKRCVISSNIFCCDSLLSLPKRIKNEGFDWIVMNPPYVGHKKIDSKYMLRLKNVYSEVYYDKGDLSYCFFMLGQNLLNPGGYMLALCARYLAQSFFARGLRKFLLENFTFVHVLDFFGIRPFKNAGIDPMIMLLQKGRQENSTFTAVKMLGENDDKSLISEKLIIKQKELTEDGFNFLNDEQSEIVKAISARCETRLGDAMEFFQGIITGLDSAFVITGDERGYESCISECGVKWIKGRNLKESRIDYAKDILLYTNTYSEWQIPDTIIKLSYHKKKLMRRRECQRGSRKWFELQWGRSRKAFDSPKIIFPYKCCENRFIADTKGYYFSADIYAMHPKSGAKDINLEKLAMLLNTPLYDTYFKSFAKKLGKNLYEYYPNTLSRVLIPDASVINGFSSKEDINKFFNMKGNDND